MNKLAYICMFVSVCLYLKQIFAQSNSRLYLFAMSNGNVIHDAGPPTSVNFDISFVAFVRSFLGMVRFCGART